MRYAKIEGGILFLAKKVFDADGTHRANAASPTIPTGWTLIDDDPVSVNTVADGLPVLSKKELRFLFLDFGHRKADIVAAINAVENESRREKLMIYWEENNEYRRDDKLVRVVKNGLGITNRALNEKWPLAPTLDDS